MVEENLEGIKLKKLAYPDSFIKHGEVAELEKIYGLDKENIIKEIKKMVLNN